jgi:hypothetical protein
MPPPKWGLLFCMEGIVHIFGGILLLTTTLVVVISLVYYTREGFNSDYEDPDDINDGPL